MDFFFFLDLEEGNRDTRFAVHESLISKKTLETLDSPPVEAHRPALVSLPRRKLHEFPRFPRKTRRAPLAVQPPDFKIYCFFSRGESWR